MNQTRYTDTHVLSREREISLKSSPMSFILSTSAGKSHLLHLIDTPGHVNFLDEVASAVRLVDGIIVVVDVVEGAGDHLPLSISLLTFGRLGYGEY
jgi:U5 small nuclear ribonucleoprotein component